MTDQTVNRIIDILETYGVPVFTLYAIISIVGFVIISALVIIIFAKVFREMKKMDGEFDRLTGKGGRK